MGATWYKTWRLVFLPLVLLSLSFIGACGKKEMPISPDLVMPGPVREFRLVQEGQNLMASWLIPQVNQLGQPLSQLQGFRVYRAAVSGTAPVVGCAPDFVLVADIDLSYPQVGSVQGERVVYQDRDLMPGKCYSYRVAAYARGGELGSWSEILSHAWGTLPRAPVSVTAAAGDREVQLSWPEVKALQDGAPIRDLAGYAVYRQIPSGERQRLNQTPLAANRYQDVAVQNEVEYTYTIRAVRRLGSYELESLSSPGSKVTPQDLTPPPPPLNLVAAITSRGVELRWEPSPAPDLAGYRVYRLRAGEARPARLTPELVKMPYFVDTRAAPGQTYAYAVTAVDNSKRANESEPSEEAVVRNK
ncbi:MAG: hypothetical protein WAU47_03670 [Desulfobaccales bacterium]